MAVAAVIAMRHAEAQIEALKAEERDRGEAVANDDIYEEMAEEILKKKKATWLSIQEEKLYNYFFPKKRKQKVEPVDEDGNPIEDLDDNSSLGGATATTAGEALLPDYYVNPENWKNAPFPVRAYLNICYPCYLELEEGTRFNNLVTFTIIVAGINVGVQTYPEMAGSIVLFFLDWLILGIFAVEIIVKIMQEGLRPWMFLVGKSWRWNNFDTAIVVLSLPFWGLEGGSSIALLRLVRLARLTKIFKKIPALQVIISGLAGGMSSITYIMILLFLVFYLYGVVGYYLFSVNDPFHFGTLMLSMLTLFRLSTLENWGDIMFLNLFGCDVYTDMYVGPEDETPFNKELWCRYPGTSWTLGPAYFISFIVVAAMVMLSLFIGAVTINMTDAMLQLKESQEKAKALAAVEQNMKRMQRMLAKQKKPVNRSRMPSTQSDKGAGVQNNQDEELSDDVVSQPEDNEVEDDIETQKGLEKMAKKYPLFAPWYWYLIRKMKQEEEHTFEVQERISVALRVAIGSQKSDEVESEAMKKKKEEHDARISPMAKAYLVVASYCHAFTASVSFGNFMTAVILTASVNVGLQTEKRIVDNHEVAVDVLEMVDIVILVIFTAEVVLKLIAEGLHPLHYFNDSWNVFDFIIVVGSYIPGAGNSVTMLRLLRLLRVLKLVKRLPQLAVIINALLNGMVSIAYVGLVLLLFFYLFSIIGMLIFSENDPWHFGSLHMAFLSLFQAATLDDWTILMYTNQYGCEKYGGVYEDFPNQCVKPTQFAVLAVAYFVIFIVFGAQVLLSLFIGVISTSMENATEEQKEEQLLEERIEKTANRLLLNEERVEAMKYVFEQLDLDGGGTISEMELKIGLDAINANMEEEEIIDILQKISPNGNEVDVNGFILFLYETPMFSKSSALAKISNAFISRNHTRTREKHNPLVQLIIDIFYYGGPARREKYERLEAVLIIQDTWRERKRIRKEKEAARRQIQEDEEALMKKRRELNASIMRDK